MPQDLHEKASQGDIDALCQLALVHELGMLMPPNLQKALQYWNQAAKLGSQFAKKRLIELNGQPAASAPRPDHKTKDLLKKILVIDDHKTNSDLMVAVLKRAGYEAVVAANGKEGLSKIAQHPDIAFIFVDLQMPVMNGFQFISTLRKLNAAEGVPIAIVTGLTKPEYVARGKSLGIQSWITKPIDKKKVVAVTKHFIGNPKVA